MPQEVNREQRESMKIAFVLYDGVTLLDFAGAYDPLTRVKTMGFVPDLEYCTCARQERIRSFEGAELVVDAVSPVLSGFDYVIIPGGNTVANLLRDREFIGWLVVPPGKTTVAAVCGGALLAGAAGLLTARRATTHPALMEILKKFAKEVTNDRVVEDDHVITAGGVTAAIDMGLYIAEMIAGRDARAAIQKQMDYPSYPPGQAR
jgi:Transcriptional regulator containing an amidase domain and an AraC-type DNA-binding HTH domain